MRHILGCELMHPCLSGEEVLSRGLIILFAGRDACATIESPNSLSCRNLFGAFYKQGFFSPVKIEN